MRPDGHIDDWQSLVAGADGSDGLLRHLPALAAALRRAPVSRFFPLMSTTSLCLATSSTYPFEGIQPAFVVLAGDLLVVYSGQPLIATDHKPTKILTTGDPAEAAQTLRGLLPDE